MQDVKTIVEEINTILRGYNYLEQDDEGVVLDELPNLVTHLLLLKIFTHEGMKLGIVYEQVDDFCEFAIQKVYDNQDRGSEDDIDLESIINEFNSLNVKH